MHPIPDSILIDRVIAGAAEVHRYFGPGLLESVYEASLCHELKLAGLSFVRQASLPVRYDGLVLEHHFQIDLIVSDSLVLMVRAEEPDYPLHEAHLLTWLRHSGYRLGLLLNFHADRLTDGIRRVVWSGDESAEAGSPRPLADEPTWQSQAERGFGQ